MEAFVKYKRQNFLIFTVFIAISFLLYFNTIPGKFVYDDALFAGRFVGDEIFLPSRLELSDPFYIPNIFLESYLPANPEINAYRPVVIFTYALNKIFFGLGPASFHIVNIILNGAVCFLVYLLVLKLFKNKVLALISGLLYAFFPIHTEALAYIKARDDVLSALFSLAAWILFINGAYGKRVNYKSLFLCSSILLLAFLSKETALISPLIFLVVYFLQNKIKFNGLFKVVLPLLPAYLVYFVLRLVALEGSLFNKPYVYYIFDPLLAASSQERFFTALKIAFLYISKIILPVNLSATYTYNQIKIAGSLFSTPEVIYGVILLGALGYFVINKRIRVNPIGIGSVIFLISYAIHSKFFIQVGEIMAERQMYFPSLGIALILGFLICKIYLFKREVAVGILLIILFFYATTTVSRNFVWSNNLTLFKSMIKDSPDSIMGYFGLSVLYLEQGKIPQAKQNAMHAMKIYPDHAPLLEVYSLVLFNEKNYTEAKKSVLRAINLRPGIVKNYETLALILAKEGRHEESIAVIKKIGENFLRRPQVRFIMAYNYLKLGDMSEMRRYLDYDTSKTEEDKIKVLEKFGR
jgi:tetratricopeptide (TPR) repeat protein